MRDGLADERRREVMEYAAHLVARLRRSTHRIISLWQGMHFVVRYCRLTGQKTGKFLAAVTRRVRYLDSRRPKQQPTL